MAVVLVLCGDSELDEYGEVLEVGQSISRPGLARTGGEAVFGTSLDEIPWALDRYHSFVATPSVTVAGRIVAIAGVFARLTLASDGWRPLPGSSWIEPVRSTADSRRIRPRIRWHDSLDRWGSAAPEEGDESRHGWRITLEDGSAEPLEKTP